MYTFTMHVFTKMYTFMCGGSKSACTKKLGKSAFCTYKSIHEVKKCVAIGSKW